MVFDWFKRSAAPAGGETPDAAESPGGADVGEPVAPAEPSPAPPDSAAPEASAEPVAESAAAAASSPAPATPAPAAAAGAAAVNEDALAWAREAYARLKAQQEAAAAQATEASPAPAPPASPPSPAAAAPAEVVAPETPAVSEAPPTAEPDLIETVPAPAIAPPQAAPEAPAEAAVPAPAAGTSEPEVPPPAQPEPPPAPAAGLSLLEIAAAQREQRRQEILAASPAPVAESVSPPAPATGSPAPAAAQAPPQDQAEPSLGAFDDDFTWSAEVLAAQGRSVEDVSLEEIDWLTRLRRGLEKTRKGFVAQLLDTLGDDPLSDETLDTIETSLLRADVGVQATDRVLEALRQRLNEEVVDPAEGLRFLKEQLRAILDEPITASGQPLLAPQRDRLNVWLMVGVNGVGKTTTLGKLANLAVRSGYSCLIAAADTFRAAAVQQVSVWGERSGVPVVSNPSSNADPAAVVFDAIGAAKARGTELVLVDTAGRLQTKHNLMEELSKVRRIIDRLAPEAVVESLLVLDASQGQNGLRQAMAFASAAGLTGVVITKLDGSARGGVALAVASEAGLPIRFIGAGETIRDLRPFSSFEFIEALLAG